MLSQALDDDGVGDAAALQMTYQCGDALAPWVIGHQQTAIAHAAGDMSGLAAWGGAQVEHALAGLGGKRFHRQGGGFGLDIVQPQRVLQCLAQAELVICEHEGGRAPGHRIRAAAQMVLQQAVLGHVGVEPQTWPRRRRHGLAEGVSLIRAGEQSFQVGQELLARLLPLLGGFACLWRRLFIHRIIRVYGISRQRQGA
jgi:hypothetical protein